MSGYFPGILASVTVGLAATFIAQHYNSPVMLMALLLGLGFQFLSEDTKCIKGIEFASRKLLRIGVAFLGMRITIDQIMSLGYESIAITVGGVVVTILTGYVVAHLMGRGWRFGILTGGAVAICGASAALAISSVLPKNENSERNVIFTVIAVTAMSTVAMIIYPIIVSALGLDAKDAGIFLGATIHDVAQVIGAGYSIGVETGDTATFIKLLRVSMLLPVVFLFSFLAREKGQQKGSFPIPFFVIGFALCVIANSMGYVPEVVRVGLVDLSGWCLVTAIAALGMKTSLKVLTEVGPQAIILILIETIVLAALVLGLLLFLH
jgi:uncharacterized integral membrane protein (TIGR00698 family)